MEELVRVEDAAWPLIIVRIPAVLDGPAIQSMFRGMERVVARKSRFATLVDTRALTQYPNALERKVLAQWMTAHTAAEALYNVGNAIVIASPAARAVLTAIHWLRRPVTAQCFVSAPVEGIDWLCMRLKQVGLAPNDAIATLRVSET
jgi:hypothetical protein